MEGLEVRQRAAHGLLAVPVYAVVSGGLLVPTDDLVDNQRVLAELKGAAGWVWAFQTGSVAVALLVAVYPANVHMAMTADAPLGLLWARLSAQGVLIAWVIRSAGVLDQSERRNSPGHASRARSATGAATTRPTRPPMLVPAMYVPAATAATDAETSSVR